MPLTPEQRTLRARLAANTRWSRQDPYATASRGQEALFAKFEREAREADPSISDAEARRRAVCAHKAHMARMTLNSLRSRAAAKSGAQPS